MANRQIDDSYHRIAADASYKNQKFNGKKSTTDVYTGEKIFYGNSEDAKHLHPLEKTADVDHVTPIAVVKERYGDLSIEQQRKIANNQNYNYAMTNSKLNRHEKNALENHEYIANKIKDSVEELENGNLKDVVSELQDVSKQAPRMIAAEAKSRVGMAVEGNGYRIQNAGASFTSGAKDTLVNSVIPLTTEAVRKLINVAQGKESLGDAVKDMGKITVNVAVTGGTKKLLADVVSSQLANSGSALLQNFANSNEVAQIIAVAAIIQDSAVKYINGEIDGKEFIEQVGEKGTTMVAGMIGGQVGREIGGIIGGIAGSIALPGVGTAAGYVAGEVIGQVLGVIITTVACSAIVSVYNTSKHLNDYKLKESQIRRLESEALKEMENQRGKFREIVERECKVWDDTIQNGFDQILRCACKETYNLQGVTDGLDKVLSVFGKNVKFSSLEEYEDQLDLPLKLSF